MCINVCTCVHAKTTTTTTLMWCHVAAVVAGGVFMTAVLLWLVGLTLAPPRFGGCGDRHGSLSNTFVRATRLSCVANYHVWRRRAMHMIVGVAVFA